MQHLEGCLPNPNYIALLPCLVCVSEKLPLPLSGPDQCREIRASHPVHVDHLCEKSEEPAQPLQAEQVGSRGKRTTD